MILLLTWIYLYLFLNPTSYQQLYKEEWGGKTQAASPHQSCSRWEMRWCPDDPIAMYVVCCLRGAVPSYYHYWGAVLGSRQKWEHPSSSTWCWCWARCLWMPEACPLLPLRGSHSASLCRVLSPIKLSHGASCADLEIIFIIITYNYILYFI